MQTVSLAGALLIVNQIKVMYLNFHCCTLQGAALVPLSPTLAKINSRLPETVHLTAKNLRPMKILVLLLFLFSINGWATSQGVSLRLQNAPLEKLFLEIKKQTTYRFVYTEEELHNTSPVSIQVNNSSVEAVLELCLKNQPVSYRFSGKYIIINKKQLSTSELINQQVIISGKVTNEKGEPLAGATVTVKEVKKSVMTDKTGSFTFTDIPVGSVLIISYIGYLPAEYKIKDQSPVLVRLQPVVNELDELTINLNTGFQQLPKERATGSFSFIDNKTLNQQVSTSVTDRLEAVVNGLYVDRSTTSPGLRIRGLSSIRGPKDPLIIVDNFPFLGDIDNLNPNDIENITVLKDAAAASIWGTKAGNGVIVITTKKGKFNQPLSADFNFNTKIISKPDLWYLPQASSSDYIDAELFLFSKGFKFSDTNNINHPPFSPVYEWLFKKKNGTVSAAEADAAINQLRTKDVRNDFRKYLYQPGLNQQYALTVKAGTTNHSWLLSAGFDKNTGTLYEQYQRASGRVLNNFRVGKKLRINTGLTYAETNTVSGNQGYGSSLSSIGLYPYASFANEEGLPLPMVKQYRLPYIDTLGGGKLLDWKFYPLTNSKHEIQRSLTQNLLLNIGLEYTVLKGLDLTLLYQLERENQSNTSLFDNESYYTRDLVNTFTQVNTSTGVTTYKVPLGGIKDVSNEALTGKNFRAGLSYKKIWSSSELNIIAGNEIRERIFTTNGFRTYGYSDNPLSYSIVDNVNLYPTFITGSSSLIPSYSGSAFSESNTRFVSFYGNAAYTFKSMYIISASARQDASNLFGVAANQKWQPLWSGGISYLLSREKFYHFDFIPTLTIRATFGYNGNVNPSKYGITTTTSESNSPYTQSPVYSFLSFYNPGLKWEKVRIANMGIDFASKNNRVKGSIDFYRKKGIDLFGIVPIDYTAGIGVTTEKNVASMSANGFDMDISALPVKGLISWQLGLNLSFNQDKVTEYYLSTLRGSSFVGKRNIISGLTGKPVYSMFAYKWAGLDPANGNPKGYYLGVESTDYAKITGSGTLVSDLAYFGPVMPKYFGSLSNTLSWKNLSISAVIIYKFGHYFRRPSVEYSTLTTSVFQHKDLAERWRNPGDEMFTNVPSMPYPNSTSRDAFYLNSEVLVQKADHIRLKYITLNYSFPVQKLKSTRIKKIEAYLNANNIGLIWTANKEKIDPEYISSLQPPRDIAFGIRCSF